MERGTGLPRPEIALHATSESRRRGALRANEVRRERSQTFREKLAERVEAELDSIIASFREAWMAGDWRAGQALIHEAFGLPVHRVEDDRDVTIVVRSLLDVEDEPGVLGEAELASELADGTTPRLALDP